MDLKHGMYHPKGHVEFDGIEFDVSEASAPTLEDDATHRLEIAQRNAALEMIDIEVKQHYAVIRKLESERVRLQSH